MDGNDQLIEGYEIGIGITISAENVYGLPQRAIDTFPLKKDNHYRLFNQDKFDHPYGSNDPLYGSWPYLTGHSATMDASVAWMNSSETYVTIESTNNTIDYAPGTVGTFISVGGKFEFFVFGTSSGPKQNQKILSELTGYAPLPPIHSLGFHYCKYEENSANLMIERNAEFNHYGFPVDVFWSDLYYTQDFEYFVFNNQTWPQWEVQALNAQIEQSKRRLVMINDPHIKASEDYFVFSQGMALQNGNQTAGDIKNIFIREPDAQNVFIANCWPGLSAWIDYLNTNGAEFWKSLYLRKNFKGSNYLYGTWNDMNEPSVFNNSTEIDQLGMPMNNTHIQADGTIVQHRWVHNAYGALMHRASWLGLLARDNNQQRPFVLTRSTFFGSQRYGAMWTGDSVVAYTDVALYI